MPIDFKTPQQLIDESQGLVHSIAKRIHLGLPPHIRLDDIISYGQLGLTQAARTFRPGQGSTFATFAYYRIRGAIYDGIAKMSWTSRSAYQRIKAERMATDVHEDNSTDRKQDATPEQEARWLTETTERLAVVYLTSGLSDGEKGDATLEDEKAEQPEEIVEREETHKLLHQLIDALPEPDASLIRMAYFEDLSLAEAAEKLGKSRSWACRLHSRILSQLGRSLNALGESTE